MELFMAYLALCVIAAVVVIYAYERIRTHFELKLQMKLLTVKRVYDEELIDTAAEDIKWLSEETIKKTNDYLQGMFKTEEP